MTHTLNIVIAQLNFLVGAIEKNATQIIAAAKKAKQTLQADLVVFPELALTGYPPEDLLFRPDLHFMINEQLQRIQRETADIALIVGYPAQTVEGLYNAAAYLNHGSLQARYAKCHLPNYGVFDEKRYFTRGNKPCIISIKGVAIGILICEDLWQAGPCTQTVQAGAQVIIVINASPYDRYKFQQREALVQRQCLKHTIPILYAHCIGGQDELVFDGGSFVVDAQGQVCQHAGFFNQTLFPVKLTINPNITLQHCSKIPAISAEEHIYGALTLGVSDYIQKNGFNGALLGLSGGIDSALTLTIAVDALGAENVEAILMPSPYTAQMSIDDAITLAENLGVHYQIIPITDTFEALLHTLQPIFGDQHVDQTEENMQARCRGIILMALSNKFGKLVLTTSNKSETAVGYTTLYGDMAGGFSVLKDVPKTLVYQLAAYRNQIKQVIPTRIITRPPSAELAPNQKDADSLPPYAELDPILELYVEQDKSVQEIVAQGFNEEIVRKIIRMVDKSEYKRRQAAPGIRITRRAFGRERRYPVTSGFSHEISTQ